MTSYAHPDALISTEALARMLNDPDLRVLDGSYKLTGVPPTAEEEYRAGHIPGARFFDIDAIADRGSTLPHMLPAPEAFAEAVGRLGIGNRTRVVVYDRPGLFSAGRVWWTFRAFGHDRVAVLDGGFKAWQAEGRPVETGAPAEAAASFRAVARPALVRTREDMLANLGSRAEQVIDARSRGRFDGAEAEARPGLRSGHIPGSLNLPFDRLTDPATGRVRPSAELERLFAEAGLDRTHPVVASCGSGITASALAFALYLIGKDDVAVYDGSWAEWGRPGDTPVATAADRAGAR